MLNLPYWETILKHRLNKLKQQAASKDDGMSADQLADKCRQVIREGKSANVSRSIVGLFTKFDNLVLERMVGTADFKQMLTHASKDAFHFK